MKQENTKLLEVYKLSDEEHNKILENIEEEVFGSISPSESPVAIIVGGQSGAGKAALISYSKNQMEELGKKLTIITTDDYKPYHPKSIEIAKRYPTQYVKIIEQDAGKWTGEVLKKAIDEKYNFIFEGTLKNARILERISELKQNGFKIIVRVLAVHEIESLLSIHERFENQIEHMGFGRLITISQHNDAYNGIPLTIEEIEKSGLCDIIEVYKRGEDITSPQLVYTSMRNKDKKYINARRALEETRKIELLQTIKTANNRMKELKRKMNLRNVSKDEYIQLRNLEKLINDRQIDDNELIK